MFSFFKHQFVIWFDFISFQQQQYRWTVNYYFNMYITLQSHCIARKYKLFIRFAHLQTHELQTHGVRSNACANLYLLPLFFLFKINFNTNKVQFFFSFVFTLLLLLPFITSFYLKTLTLTIRITVSCYNNEYIEQRTNGFLNKTWLITY